MGPIRPQVPVPITDDDEEFQRWKAMRARATPTSTTPDTGDDDAFSAWKQSHGATGSWGDDSKLSRGFRDVSMAVLNGMAPGFADEIQARAEPGNVQQNELVERAGRKRFKAAHPVANLVGEGVGMIANPLGRSLGLVKGGAVFGGLAGAGEADGDMGDRAIGGTVGALAGAGTGAALKYVAGPVARVGYDFVRAGAKNLAASPATQATVEWLRTHPVGLSTLDVSGGMAPGGTLPPNATRAATGLGARVSQVAGDLAPRSPQDRANALILEKLEADRLRLDDARQRLGLTTKPMGLGDLAGDNTMGLMRGARSVPSRAKDEIPAALHARAEQQPVRVRADLERAAGVGPVDVLAKVDELAAQQKANAKPMYDAAYAQPPITDPDVLQLFKDPDVKRAYASAARQAKREGVILPPVDEAATSAMPVQGFDYVKRGLDDYIERRMSGGKMGRNEARQLRNLLGDALQRVDAINPAYKQARATFAGDQALRNALDAGREFAKTDGREVARLLGTMTPGEREVYAQGALDNLTQQIRGTTDGHDVVRKVFGNDLKREALRSLVGDDAFRGLAADMEGESRMTRTRNFTLGGSNTVDKAQEAFDLDKAGIPQAALSLMKGNLGGAAANLGQSALLNRLRGVTTETADALSPKLIAGMNGDRNALDEVIKELLQFRTREIQRQATRSTAARPFTGAAGGAIGGTFGPRR